MGIGKRWVWLFLVGILCLWSSGCNRSTENETVEDSISEVHMQENILTYGFGSEQELTEEKAATESPGEKAEEKAEEVSKDLSELLPTPTGEMLAETIAEDTGATAIGLTEEKMPEKTVKTMPPKALEEITVPPEKSASETEPKESEIPETTELPKATVAPKPEVLLTPTAVPKTTEPPKPVETIAPQPTEVPVVHIHALVVGKQEATCLTEGVEKEYCSVCGEVIREDVVQSALGHDFVKSIWELPTCQKGGYYNNICNRCGVVECVTQEPLPHEIKDIVLQEGNCMSDTVIQHICELCGVKVKTDTRFTNYDAHNWITEKVDGMEVVYCEWCGIVE